MDLADNGVMDRQLRVMTVCTGNICRSPMAEVVLRERLAEAGIDDVVVDSTGTTGYEVGSQMDPRARRILLDAGYSDAAISGHRARQVHVRDLEDRDLVLAATTEHVHALHRVVGLRPGDDDAAHHVRLIRSFDPDSGAIDLADPWYGDETDFVQCLAEVEATVDGILDEIRALRAAPSS